MRKINKPNENPANVFLTCISRIKDCDLKRRLESVVDNISEAAGDYDHNGIARSFSDIEQHDNIANIVTKDEMVKVYTNRMAKKGAPGRSIYDKLKASAPQGVCPLCGQRIVSTLDHYLPKANFPSLVVVPYNLIPACSECNKMKLTSVPNTSEEQTLHPYYDDVTTDQWLFATVVEDAPASIRFLVRLNNNLNDVLKDRIHNHFNIFGLGSLYASHAGVELANIRNQLRNILIKVGADGVQEHLEDSFRSRYSNHINSWETAMYQAIANNTWFYNGGFNID